MTKLCRRGVAALVVALLLSVVACSGRDDNCACRCDDQRQLSTALLSRLAAARAYHHQADILLARNDLAGAIAKVEAVLKLDLDARWPEAEEVRLDATARLAQLLAREGAHDRALTVIDKALAQKPRPSFYAANLHSVRGELLEAQVKRLDQAGKKDEAKAVARQAMTALETSIRINKALQRQLRAAPASRLEGPAGPASRPSQPQGAGGKR